jgi:hypothetical protein
VADLGTRLTLAGGWAPMRRVLCAASVVEVLWLVHDQPDWPNESVHRLINEPRSSWRLPGGTVSGQYRQPGWMPVHIWLQPGTQVQGEVHQEISIVVRMPERQHYQPASLKL